MHDVQRGGLLGRLALSAAGTVLERELRRSHWAGEERAVH
jgi:hypothetical protein